ncbi:MAG: type II toxin-antitoxin system Phd/YefM family antitoxin [Deinococcus sp.]|nr:type II toxin-antitoxin system Phd/YefM family antitoxin [Deinococcus sp.]
MKVSFQKRQDTVADTARRISASEFKASCLALLDEVAQTGLPLIVTKRGKPLAKLVPLGEPGPPNLLGSVRYKKEDDLLSPVDEIWEADR